MRLLFKDGVYLLRAPECAATIQGRCLFAQSSRLCGYYSRTAFICSELLNVRLLFKDGVYLLRAPECAATIQGRRLFAQSS